MFIRTLTEEQFEYVLARTKEFMEEHGMTQSSFAQFIGVELKTVSRWLNRRNRPRGLSLETLAARVGITNQEILDHGKKKKKRA